MPIKTLSEHVGLCALVLALSISTGYAAPRNVSTEFEKAYQLLETADRARDSEKFREAESLYREALRTYIDLSGLYPDWQPGIVKFRIMYCDKQLEAVSRQAPPRPAPAMATSVLPRSASTAPAAGMVPLHKSACDLLRAGKTAEARSLLLDGLRLDPDSVKTRLLIGITQCEAGEYEDAIYLLKQLSDENPRNASARLALATAYFGLGMAERAQKELEIAVELEPGSADAHFNLAQICLLQRPANVAAARQHYNKAVALGSRRDADLERQFLGN